MASEVKDWSTRYCPCCDEKSYKPKPLFDNVISCNARCGMIYADTAKTQAEYDAYYSQPGRYTTEWSAWNYWRYVETADRFETLGIRPDAIILDVGCGAGGLVDVLYRMGFYNANGIDPAAPDSEDPDNRIRCGSLQDVTPGHDVVILSHVLEHVCDVKGLLSNLREQTKHLYVEVPDARRYHVDEVSPYQQFNEEHINHWDMGLLIQTLSNNGFSVRACGESTCDPNKFPVIWAYAEANQSQLSDAVALYCDKSAGIMATLEKQIAAIQCEVICWGIGALARRLEPLLVGKVAWAVDANPRDKFAGEQIVPPSEVGPFCEYQLNDRPYPLRPIFVTTILHRDSVLKQIAEMGLKNPVIKLGA